MSQLTPNSNKRDCLLLPGCKDLMDVLKQEHLSALDDFMADAYRVNEQIQAEEVRVIDRDGKNLGLMARSQTLELAKILQKDLVHHTYSVNPPVCMLMDFGKFSHDMVQSLKKLFKMSQMLGSQSA